MFDEIFSSFLDDDSHLAKDDWRPLFIPRKAVDDKPMGYALVDAGEIGGVLGTYHSSRWVRDRHAKFCNLHSWYVKESYRSHSLRLLQPALRIKECTFTDFTPNALVRKIFCTRLGFKPLDSSLRILLPLAPGIRSSRKRRGDIVTRYEELQQHLSEPDRALLSGHTLPNFGHVLVSDNNQSCYVLYTIVTRHLLTFCHIHYISNKPLFSDLHDTIREHITKTEQARYVVLDERAVAGMDLPFSFKLAFGSHQLYRSSEISPQDIDYLYSEISVLRLPTFLSVRGMARSAYRRLSLFATRIRQK